LKTHYPAAFMAATLTAELDNTDRVVSYLADCNSMGIQVTSPDINSGSYSFRPTGETEISYGLGAVKGVGKAVVDSIVEERNENGCYANLYDFCRRQDMRKINKRALEALIKCGAMDSVGSNRATLMSDISSATRAAGQQQQDRESGQFDMFGVEQSEVASPQSQSVPEWSEQERLTAEKETLGLYLTGHPYNRYAGELDTVAEADVSTLDLTRPRNGIVAGIIVAKRVLNTRRGKMAFITLDNARSRVEVSLYAEKFNEYYAKLQKDSVLVALGELSTDEFTGGCQMRAEILYEVDEVRTAGLACMELVLEESEVDRNSMASLQQVLKNYRNGNTRISIRYTRSRGETGLINLGDSWKVIPHRDVIDGLHEAFGMDCIHFHYDSLKLLGALPEKQVFRPYLAVNN
jgi:DNA polymerase-3 subunit alpha